jgi:hypothetical protein
MCYDGEKTLQFKNPLTSQPQGIQQASFKGFYLKPMKSQSNHNWVIQGVREFEILGESSMWVVIMLFVTIFLI